MKNVVMISVIIAAILKFDNIYAQEDVRSPFKLKEINISTSEKDKKEKIHLKVDVVEDGEVSVEFHASKELKDEVYPIV